MQGKTVNLASRNDTPSFGLVSVNADEGRIRSELLMGVAAGRIAREDLPMYVEFSKGNDELFDEWSVFKKQLGLKALSSIKEEVALSEAQMQEEIERKKITLEKLEKLKKTTDSEIMRITKELTSSIVFLQGEKYPTGTHHTLSDNGDGSLIPLGNGITDLMDAFEKLRPRKGLYVICDHKIHLIHHAFVESKDRAFLIGESKDYLPSKPEKVKQIIDNIYELLNSSNSSSSPSAQ